MAILIRVDGSKDNVVPADWENGFTLPELYVLLNCTMVEVVYNSDGNLMLIDEEGKLKDGWESRVNMEATHLVQTVLRNDDVIVGNALICAEEEFK